MVVFPNAKINIGLNIISRRNDGYHDIETVMYPIAWHDILEVVTAKGTETTLTVTGRHVDCPAEKNLVMKAYRRLQQEVDLPPVDIYLHKIIPDGAGLGGGSSDAAFMLKALNEMFALGFEDSQLADMAADLGSDCPFFIYNKPMLACGRGELLSDIPVNAINRYSIAVVKPEESVSTKEAYSSITPAIPQLPLNEAIKLWERQLNRLDEEDHSALIKNDFEASVFPNHPAIAEVKRKMLDSGAIYASMSGSGSAVYGLFDLTADKLTAIIDTEFADMSHSITAANLL